MKRIFIILGLAGTLSLMGSCNTKEKDTSQYDERVEVKTSSDNKEVQIFGRTTSYDEFSVLAELEDADVMKVDTIKESNGEFQSAIVEFAGVKFCMNKGYIFFTSRKDNAAVKALINEISEFYGEPQIDGEDEDDLVYNYYHWNLYGEDETAPYIRLRPVHSDEGGLTMMWRFL